MDRNGEQRKAVTEPEPRRSIDGQVAAAQAIIAKWLESCKEIRRARKPASFTFSDSMEKIATAGARQSQN